MLTYKQRLNEKYGLDKDTEHTLRELKQLTGVPINIMKEVEKRGKGAYANNLGSVRLNDFSKNDDLRKGASKRLSKEQWSKARIYAFLFKSIFQNMRYKKHDMDLFEKLKTRKLYNIRIYFFSFYMYMEQIQISISPAQMTKIRKGLPIQIKHGSMGNGDMVVFLHPENAKKMASAFKRGKGLRIQMDEDEVRASGLLGSLKKIGKKVEKGVVNAGNTVAKPTKKVISKIPKPVRDVLQQEAQGLVDTTGATLGTLISTATGDEELGNMVKQGISDTGNELLSGQRLSLGSKILPIAKRSVNVVVDQIEDPRYRAVAKQIVKKSGAGLYGKAGSGLTGRGLSGSGLSGSGLKRSAVVEEPFGMVDMRERRSAVIRPAVMPREPRFQKGSQEAKDCMASIRNNKQGSGFFKKIGKQIKKGASNAGKDTKKALFGKRIGDEAQFVLPIAGGIIGGTAGSMAGGPFGSAVGGAAGGAAGKYLGDDIKKRGYGMKSGKGRRNSMVRPASDMPTFSPYAGLYSPQNHPFVPRSSFQNGGSGERIM